MSHTPQAALEGTYSPDNLIAGDAPVRAENVTILSGQDLVRGAVVGQVTASGKWILSLSGAVDGSETPAGIIVSDIDASGGDATGSIYIAGDFNERALTLGTGHTVTSVRDAFRGTPIHILPSVSS